MDWTPCDATPGVPRSQPTVWDADPPTTFLASLSPNGTASFGCSAAAFFGAGGPEAPDRGLECKVSSQADAALVARVPRAGPASYMGVASS